MGRGNPSFHMITWLPVWRTILKPAFSNAVIISAGFNEGNRSVIYGRIKTKAVCLNPAAPGPSQLPQSFPSGFYSTGR